MPSNVLSSRASSGSQSPPLELNFSENGSISNEEVSWNYRESSEIIWWSKIYISKKITTMCLPMCFLLGPSLGLKVNLWSWEFQKLNPFQTRKSHPRKLPPCVFQCAFFWGFLWVSKSTSGAEDFRNRIYSKQRSLQESPENHQRSYWGRRFTYPKKLPPCTFHCRFFWGLLWVSKATSVAENFRNWIHFERRSFLESPESHQRSYGSRRFTYPKKIHHVPSTVVSSGASSGSQSPPLELRIW